jgi:hypothetical protein
MNTMQLALKYLKMNRFLLLSFSFLFISCNNHEITLEGVRYTPEYFRNDMVWGENETAIKTMNLYLVKTGIIDTTSEKPPLQIAFIAIDNKTIQLNSGGQTITDNDITQIYETNGYKLTITQSRKIASDSNRKAVISISRGELSSKYKLIGKPGSQ